jgi:hypothetical protein
MSFLKPYRTTPTALSLALSLVFLLQALHAGQSRDGGYRLHTLAPSLQEKEAQQQKGVVSVDFRRADG